VPSPGQELIFLFREYRVFNLAPKINFLFIEYRVFSPARK
jgi:hypothetical protein